MKINNDVLDREAMKKVPELTGLINAINAIWGDPHALHEALKPVITTVDKVTAIVNADVDKESRHGRS